MARRQRECAAPYGLWARRRLIEKQNETTGQNLRNGKRDKIFLAISQRYRGGEPLDEKRADEPGANNDRGPFW